MWILRGSLHDVALEVRREAPADAAWLAFHGQQAALIFLRGYADDPDNLRVLRDLLADRAGSVDVTLASDQDVLEEVAARIVGRRLGVRRIALETVPMTFSDPLAGRAPSEPEPRPSRPPPTLASADRDMPEEEEKTWVAIEVQDEDGNPLRGVRYAIELPDGSVRRGTTDRDGKARVDGIDPGTCKVSFPELDQDAWEAA